MLLTMVKSKIHMAVLTETVLEYSGSITIPADLMEEANILAGERVQIANARNGERLETYVIEGKRGDGKICLNGPAAHKGQAGDKIVGVDGTDFADAKRKMILAVVWQMMRFHYLSVIGGKTEEQILDWANGMVKDEKFRLSSFKDKSAVSGQFYIHLCAGIEPRAVDWDIV